MAAAPDDHYAHCEALLRENDRDLWLASLFAPQPARRHIQAVYAFSIETRGVRAKVSQPLLGEMRLRWWSDAIEADAAEGGARAHPVADALLDTADRFDLPRAELLALVEAHIFDLYDDPMPTLAALEDYCRATVAAPMQWAAQILSAPESDAFTDAGVALGRCRALGRPFGPFIPRDILARHGVEAEPIAATPELRAALAELRDITQAHYERARRAAADLNVGREALLPAAVIPLFLERLARKDYDPFQAVAEPSPLRRQWRLWRAARGVGL